MSLQHEVQLSHQGEVDESSSPSCKIHFSTNIYNIRRNQTKHSKTTLIDMDGRHSIEMEKSVCRVRNVDNTQNAQWKRENTHGIIRGSTTSVAFYLSLRENNKISISPPDTQHFTRPFKFSAEVTSHLISLSPRVHIHPSLRSLLEIVASVFNQTLVNYHIYTFVMLQLWEYSECKFNVVKSPRIWTLSLCVTCDDCSWS